MARWGNRKPSATQRRWSVHATQVRARRQQVDNALRELQEIKGPGCGARVAGRSDAVEYAPQIMTLKAQVGTAAWNRGCCGELRCCSERASRHGAECSGQPGCRLLTL